MRCFILFSGSISVRSEKENHYKNQKDETIQMSVPGYLKVLLPNK